MPRMFNKKEVFQAGVIVSNCAVGMVAAYEFVTSPAPSARLALEMSTHVFTMIMIPSPMYRKAQVATAALNLVTMAVAVSSGVYEKDASSFLLAVARAAFHIFNADVLLNDNNTHTGYFPR